MSNRVFVDLFAEDRAHEELLKSLVVRIAEEEQLHVRIRVRSARGGHGRAISEFQRYQCLAVSDNPNSEMADMIVVAIDGNCSTFAKARENIQRATVESLVERLVIACPDPHIERWYLADPPSFERVVGHRPMVGPKKCARHHYKRILADSIHHGGNPATLGGPEFAPELVEVMDLYRAGRGNKSLKAFLDDFRTKLRSLK